MSFGTLLITELAAGLVIAATGGNFKGSFDVGWPVEVAAKLWLLLVDPLLVEIMEVVAAVAVVDFGCLGFSGPGEVLEALEKLCSKGLGS
jgi:hypothetical protein